MNTFLKRIFSRARADGGSVLVFYVFVLLVTALLANGAISQGKDVSFDIAWFLKLTTTTPAAKASEPRSSAISRSGSGEGGH